LPALKRNKFIVFWLLSFVLMLFFAGASHGRVYPPNTRMFMLLPWWVTFAAFGITDIVEWLQGLFKGVNISNRFTGILLIGILAANLVQVNWVFPCRTAGLPNLEVLFLRLAHKIDNDPADPQPVYLFVTEENWGIDGIRLLQDLYQTPQSKKQLDRIYLTGDILTSDQIQLIQASHTVIIPQPWMKPEWQEGLKPVLSQAGKLPCEIKNTLETPVKFTAYFPAEWIGFCPAGGEWGE